MNRDYDAGYRDGTTHLAVATVESLRPYRRRVRRWGRQIHPRVRDELMDTDSLV